MNSPTDVYEIEAKRTVYPDRSGRRVRFRSVLEARWALAFDLLHIDWTYEPERFVLPTGHIYTPDFYLDGIGFVEIKPHMQALKAVEPKLHAFAQHKAEVIPGGTAGRFFSIDADGPQFARPGSMMGAVIEWTIEGVRGLSEARALNTFCSPRDHGFRSEYPKLYAGHVDRILRYAYDVPFGRCFKSGETVDVTMSEFAEKKAAFEHDTDSILPF